MLPRSILSFSSSLECLITSSNESALNRQLRANFRSENFSDLPKCLASSASAFNCSE